MFVKFRYDTKTDTNICISPDISIPNLCIYHTGLQGDHKTLSTKPACSSNERIQHLTKQKVPNAEVNADKPLYNHYKTFIIGWKRSPDLDMPSISSYSCTRLSIDSRLSSNISISKPSTFP